MARYSLLFLLVAVIGLIGLGIVMLASTSPWVEPEHLKYSHVKKQALFLGLGLFAAIAAARLPLELYERFWWVFLLLAVALLTLCYVPGIQVEVNGSRRWIKFPVINQFQPSEPAKIAIIVALAAWMARQQSHPGRFFKGFCTPMVLLAVPVGLIFFEKDMGTAAAIGGACFILLFVAGTKPIYLSISAITGLVALFFAMKHDENRWARFMAFQNLEATRLDYGLQQYRALQAFTSGGVTGTGLGNGAEKHGYLPFAHTDFIYPIIGEELGLPATLGVILAFVIITFAGILIASKSESHFATSLAVGLTAIIVIPAVMNIGVTTALLPNTGLPLPFVSYGGSNLIFTLVAVGILCGIALNNSASGEEAVATTKRSRKILKL